jgi:hypothetical protein
MQLVMIGLCIRMQYVYHLCFVFVFRFTSSDTIDKQLMHRAMCLQCVTELCAFDIDVKQVMAYVYDETFWTSFDNCKSRETHLSSNNGLFETFLIFGCFIFLQTTLVLSEIRKSFGQS